MVHVPAYLFGFSLRLSHALVKWRCAVFSERCHFHVSHAARSHIVRALPGLWYGIAVLPCFSASRKVPVTRCGLPLRGTYAAYSAFSFGFCLSALRNTHNPLELHGKRMAERLPLQCSGTLSGGTLCHLPTVVPHRFFRRGFRLYRLRIAQPFSMCRHTVTGWEVRPPATDRGVAHAVRRMPVIYRWRESG